MHRRQEVAVPDVRRVFDHCFLLRHDVRVTGVFQNRPGHPTVHFSLSADREFHFAVHRVPAVPPESSPRDDPVRAHVPDTGGLPVENRRAHGVPHDSVQHVRHRPFRVHRGVRFRAHGRSVHVPLPGRVPDTDR